MNYLKSFIKWLDGKKTIIGLIGMNILQLDMQVIAGMNPDLKTLLLWICGALAGVGLTHKVAKNKK